MSGRSRRSAPIDGFALAYDLYEVGLGDAPAVVLLHGWPGDRADWREVVPLLAGRARVVVPDLRGFGDSDKHPVEPVDGYSAQAQVRSVLALLDELGVDEAVFAGYDIGSRLVQTIAGTAPDRAVGLVMTPPLPGAGERLLAPAVQREFWYQVLHRLPLADALVDGRPEAVRAYLAHFWTHWSGPGFTPADAELDRLAELYGAPGAFTASIGWYRSRRGVAASGGVETAPVDPLRLPVEVVWPTHDPLFPREWADRLGEWYADLSITMAEGAGHFVPLEAPHVMAQAVLRLL